MTRLLLALLLVTPIAATASADCPEDYKTEGKVFALSTSKVTENSMTCDYHFKGVRTAAGGIQPWTGSKVKFRLFWSNEPAKFEDNELLCSGRYGWRADNEFVSDPRCPQGECFFVDYSKDYYIKVYGWALPRYNSLDAIHQFASDLRQKVSHLAAPCASSSPKPCDPAIVGDLSPRARRLHALACDHNFSFLRSANYKYTDIGYYVKDEDGVTPLIRTGYEVALYKRIKNKFVNMEVHKPISMEGLFDEAIFAILDKDRGESGKQHVQVNVLDAILTAHNVTRLLARPEQWLADYPKTDAGQNRQTHDRARSIFDDLLGNRSVDIYPTLFLYNHWRQLEPGEIVEVLFGPSGVFEFHHIATVADDGYKPSHWNGGIHYYFWVGALVEYVSKAVYDDLVPGTSGGPLAGAGVYYYEYWQKKLQGVGLRGKVQLERGYEPGRNWMQEVDAGLEEMSRVIPDLVHGGAR